VQGELGYPNNVAMFYKFNEDESIHGLAANVDIVDMLHELANCGKHKLHTYVEENVERH
jgi:hypothetical protein